MKYLFTILLFFSIHFLVAQTVIHGFTFYTVNSNIMVGLKYPSDTSGSKKFATLLASGGNGEVGTDGNVMFNVGVGRQFIQYPSLMPDSIIYALILPINVTYQAAMQQPNNMFAVMDFIDSKTRHSDTTNWMLAGLSQGATNAVETLVWPASLSGFGDPTNYRYNRVKKIVESSMCNLRGSEQWGLIANKGCRMFAGSADGTCAQLYTDSAYSSWTGGGGYGTKVVIAGGGHDNGVWDSAFSPRGTDTLHNIYFWLLNKTITVSPPSCTTNSSPSNGSTIGTSTTASLSWTASSGATSYKIYLWSGTTAPSSPTDSTSTTSYSATGLIASTLYHWYIVPKNSAGSATGCITDTTRFTTAASSTGAGPGSLVLRSMSSIYGTGTTQFSVFTPYDSTSSPYKHPLIIHMDGDGENNNTNFANSSPGWYAANGATMRFYNSSYSRYSTFYILIPHQVNSVNAVWSTSYVKDMLAWAKANLSTVIDTTQIYVTGLYYGGGGVYSVIADTIKYANRFAASAAMAPLRSISRDALLSKVRDSHLPLWVWQSTSSDAATTRDSNIAVLTYQQSNYSTSTPQVRFTLPLVGGVYGSWLYGFDTGHVTNYVDSSYFGGPSVGIFVDTPNVYEWLLSKRRLPDTTTARPGSLVLKSMTSIYGSGTTQFHLFTPGDSAISSYKHPLIIHMDGDAENNNTSFANSSPGWYAANGASMRFYNATYGRYSTFYLLIPHQVNSVNAVWSASYVKDMLAWAKANLYTVIDTTQIYMTGLYYGGGGVYSVIADSIRYASNFAAAAAMAPWRTVTRDTLLSHIRDSHLPLWVWQSTSSDAATTRDSNIAVLTYQQAHYSANTPQVRFTLPLVGGVYGSWLYGFDTGHAVNYVDSSYFGGPSVGIFPDSPNVYEWLLTKQRTSGSGFRVIAQVTPAIPFANPTDAVEQYAVVSPNPVVRGQQAIVLVNSHAAGAVRAQLLNVSGAQINTSQLSLSKGLNRVFINTGGLAKGVYLIRIYGISFGSKMIKLVVD